MNKGYAVFCDADRHFYDAPHRMAHTGRNALYPAATAPVPEGWQRHRTGDWLALRPMAAHLPPQGWKIHVSATLDNAESVLERVMAYCLARAVAFKFVPSRHLLHTRNAKYADRSGSGKFITVYPADDARCAAVAADLDALLAGEEGPYVLSDLRWNRGPVYLRYGSFTRRDCYDERGELRPALENADGVLVPDVRGPAFRMPEWIEPPGWLHPHLAARAAATVADMPYTIEKALHFSNGGGVYVGTDTRTGAKVVLKEGRPHAGLAADGADAVTRLKREQAALERLSGLGCTPEVLDSFELGEHRFLVMEFVEGRPLNSFFARRHPLIEADPSTERLAEYTEWALRIHGLVADATAAVHARGVVFNDLHLFNIMVSEDESKVVLLDFEAAAPAAENRRQTVANPAFVAPADRRGFDVDRYALACLRLALFIPLTSLLALDRTKAAHLAEIAARQFPVARGFLREAVEEICRTPDGPSLTPSHPYLPVAPGDWPHSRDSLAEAIRASATPDRTDRCFPGDVAQFATTGGGLNVAYGAAGVLYALDVSGAGRFEPGEEWLLARTKELLAGAGGTPAGTGGTPARKNSRAETSGTPLGFYDGLAGIAWTLEHLGHRARALELTELALAQPWEALAPDLHGGLAGLGLALDALGAATGERALHDAALRCADLVAQPREPSARAGLLHGATGGALLLLRLYERSGDPGLLDLAADALRRDLARCVRSAGGTLQVSEGWRTMPYLGAGSVGIGAVLDDYLAHRADEEFERARRDIVAAAQATFYAQPGLFRGAAGMVLHLSRTTAPGPGTDADAVRRQIDALAWHAVPHDGRLAFPGEQMMRLSMDLATGAAGCLLALAAACEPPSGTAHLPFLPPPPRGRPPEPVPSGTVPKNTVPSERNHHEHS
ncbi:serine/threonine protein kinase [Streptomyces spiroverticillatus]|uniref:non-specific serine/threonine protein kinase n=1 Tax=Streptomyces finlayi TaxID=67296 RepID=A0A919CC37_9ACTN|nr:class III lanthionine synthetase LanKC [Streptomyces finlayi]GHA22854.1 serine/threonine protein kinase [Streptomyces spiroverticillatus]GHD04640.1 serine/threonine protein kinase [Streptomyces finlayi]